MGQFLPVWYYVSEGKNKILHNAHYALMISKKVQFGEDKINGFFYGKNLNAEARKVLR